MVCGGRRNPILRPDRLLRTTIYACPHCDNPCRGCPPQGPIICPVCAKINQNLAAFSAAVFDAPDTDNAP